ncbi:MAG: twin-arginine translocase TatA/TatE family subunit [Planctomycetota bacterium]
MVLAFHLGDVSGGELVVIGLIALILFGQNLPRQMRNVGKYVAAFKRTINEASQEIHREMDAAAESMDAAARDAAKEVSKDNPLPAVAQELHNSVTEAGSAAAAYDTAPQPGPVTAEPGGMSQQPAMGASAAAPSEPPRRAELPLSAAAALDELARNLPPPSKIPPPVI